MTMMTRILAGGLGMAAIAAAAPASAQYQYGYAPPYGNAYGYNAYGYQANMQQYAASQCAAAVQQRLSHRSGMQGILGAVLGAQTPGGRVLNITRIEPRSNIIRVRGLANSGRYAYSPYGYAYGAAGAGYQADLSFRCNVDYRGRVRDIDINRRR